MEKSIRELMSSGFFHDFKTEDEMIVLLRIESSQLIFAP